MELTPKITVDSLSLKKMHWADYMVLFASSSEEAIALVKCAIKIRGEVGLRIDHCNSQHMVVGKLKNKIMIIPRVWNLKYIGV